MSDGNDSIGREASPLRHRDNNEANLAAERPTPGPMGSPEAEQEEDSSPRRSRMAFMSDDGSMTSNRAQHSASFSFSNKRAGSGELPDDCASDRLSDQLALNHPNGRRQTPRAPQPRSRPVSRAAADSQPGRASPGGSESRLRYSVNTTHESGGTDEGTPRLPRVQQMIHPGPLPNDERFPLTASARQDEMGSLSRASDESAEDSGRAPQSAGYLGHDQKSAGGTFAASGEEELINEIRAIYAGIVMVEKRCMEYNQTLSQPNREFSSQEWQKFIAVHRTMLYEHHDFFLACQNPLASPVLKRLPEKYAMPARMWRYGIHAFLEALRHRLPASLEYMLTFIYLAYSMMTLMLETVPAFEETWIECLGDLSRYRMAVEEADFREREVWAGVARYWYNKAADRNPGVGRIQHHLAVLARPDVVQQLFYYTKSLVCVQSFAGTRESILLLFSPLLNKSRTVHRLPELVATFVTAHGHLFTRNVADPFMGKCEEFLLLLAQYVGRTGPNLKMQGVHIVSCNFASMLGYGTPGADLLAEFLSLAAQPSSMRDIYVASQRQWTHVGDLKTIEADFTASRQSATGLPLAFYGSCLAFQTLAVMLDHIGNKNIYPAFHTTLAFLWCLARTSNGMKHVEVVVPWKQIATFLNTLIRTFTDFALIEGPGFPTPDEEKWLPEDFLIRGQVWSQHLYPLDFFNNAPDADEGRNIEPPSRDLWRTHRCLWLGVRLAMFNRWITYDATSRKFSATDFASELDKLTQRHNPFYGRGLQTRLGTDVEMQES